MTIHLGRTDVPILTAPSITRAGSESLPQASRADWAGPSALGFGHARRDTAAGDPGGADAEEGSARERGDLVPEEIARRLNCMLTCCRLFRLR
jgi:hypothetical protein